MSQYIYILLNPALKNLVKIGRTSRTPEERAQELSAATGVPQPFLVAYESLVSDGVVAESLIHAELSRDGYRLNEAREFFEIPLKVAVAVVDRICRTLPAFDGDTVADESVDNAHQAAQFVQVGRDHLTGTYDVLQDFELARQFLERAVTLGDATAYRELASVHLWGLGVRRNPGEAFRLLQEGGKKGDAECLLRLWEIYAGRAFNSFSEEHERSTPLSNPSNAEVAFSLYLDALNRTGEAPEVEPIKDYVGWALSQAPNIAAMYGRHTATLMDQWVSICREMAAQYLEARAHGIPIEDALDSATGKPLSMKHMMELRELLNSHGRSPSPFLKATLSGFSREDLEYAFSRLPELRMREWTANFVPYLNAGTNSPQPATLQPRGPTSQWEFSNQSPPNTSATKEGEGWFRRLASALTPSR
jgi:TPR repeat protein